MLRLKGASKGAYEVGVIKARDGVGFELLYDQYGGGGHALEAKGGKDMERLADEYNAEVAMRQLAADGYTVEREVDEETGELEVVAYKA